MPEDALRKWREAVERALALGPDVAETRMRAAQYYFMTGDARASDEHFKRAIALNPSDPLVLGASASFAIMRGDLNEAISLWRRAVTVDPLSATSRFNLGLHLLAVEKWEEAKAELQKARAMRATSREDIDAEIAKILMLQQHFDEALAMAVELPDSPRKDQCLALIHHAIGNAPSADAALARLIAASKRSDSGVAVKLSIAEVYAFRGESDEAFRWLGDANRQTHDDMAVVPNWWARDEMQISPFLKSLHADPRWQVYDAAIRARI